MKKTVFLSLMTPLFFTLANAEVQNGGPVTKALKTG